MSQDCFLPWEMLLHAHAGKCKAHPEGAGWWSCVQVLCGLSQGRQGAQGEGGEGRAGAGEPDQLGLPLKGAGRPFKLRCLKGCGLLGSKALHRSDWDMNRLQVDAAVLGHQGVDQGPEAEAASCECCEPWNF